MTNRYKGTVPYPFKLCQDNKLLLYFHRLHQARVVADIEGKKVVRKEAKRVKGKYLFSEAWGATE